MHEIKLVGVKCARYSVIRDTFVALKYFFANKKKPKVTAPIQIVAWRFT
jgi:hypothetical protein